METKIPVFSYSHLLAISLFLVFSRTTAANEISEPPAPEGPVLLNLRNVVERVERENLDVLLNREGIEDALQVVRQRRADFFPSMEIAVSQTRSQFVNVGRGFDIPGRDPIVPPSNRFDSTLQSNLTLFDSELMFSYQSAKLGYEISKLDHEALLQNVLEATLSVYLDHLNNLSLMEVIEADIERNQSLLGLARERLRSGVATEIDVTRAEVALARSEQRSLQHETVILQSELQLKQLLNMDLDREIIIEPLVKSLERTPVDQDRMALHDILKNRADYQSAVSRKQQNEVEKKSAIWQRLPRIGLFANYGYAAPDPFNENFGEAWSIGVQLSVPVFEGFRIDADRMRAASAVRTQEYVIRSLEQSLGSEYRLQLKEVRSNFEQIAVAKKSRDLSRRELELAITRFQRGVADNTEVIDAQNSLAEAENNYVESIYNYGLARLSLARTTGNVKSILDLEDTP